MCKLPVISDFIDTLGFGRRPNRCDTERCQTKAEGRVGALQGANPLTHYLWQRSEVKANLPNSFINLSEHSERLTTAPHSSPFTPFSPSCCRSIRYPMPTWVWIYLGSEGTGSIFLRRVAMNTRRDGVSLERVLPQTSRRI